jgi:hypothetical protein
MAITYGSDYAVSSSSTSNTRTDALTLGSTGSGAILFVVIEQTTNAWSEPITIQYNGVDLTPLTTLQSYSGSNSATHSRVYYLNNSLTSGQNLFINSSATTGLGINGSVSWRYKYFTYGGVAGGLGTVKINTTDFTTSSGGTPATVAFNFTPSSATSTILQMLPGFSISTTTTTYGSTTGTTRQNISPSSFGSNASWLAFSDYAPGSTSTYSISQSFNPNFTSATGYGWAVELLQSSTPVVIPFVEYFVI